MNRCRFSDETGLAGQILVGVVAWALGAVLLLTNTLVAAQQIDSRVDRITHTVGPIDHDLDSVSLAAETNRIAGEINTAANAAVGAGRPDHRRHGQHRHVGQVDQRRRATDRRRA